MREPSPGESVAAGGRVARRIILCDGAESARLWARTGTGSDENLTWVPRDNEPRARPPGFHALQGGLSVDAVGKLDAREGVLAFLEKREPEWQMRPSKDMPDLPPTD